MYVDGILDFMMMIVLVVFKIFGEKEENFVLVVKKVKICYFFVFEKVSYKVLGFLYFLLLIRIFKE